MQVLLRILDEPKPNFNPNPKTKFSYPKQAIEVVRSSQNLFSVFLPSPAVPPSQLPPLPLSSTFPFPNLSSLTFVWSSLTVCRLQSPPPVFLLICRLTSCCHASLFPTSFYSFSLSWRCVLLHFLLSFLPHPLPELFFSCCFIKLGQEAFSPFIISFYTLAGWL